MAVTLSESDFWGLKLVDCSIGRRIRRLNSEKMQTREYADYGGQHCIVYYVVNYIDKILPE
ncbi:hypothetical protein AGMMS49983_11910 [Clostridia bacterium]|nr:hypothetical protein AGMMS49983_11910 [Clostridia bacterium]